VKDRYLHDFLPWNGNLLENYIDYSPSRKKKMNPLDLGILLYEGKKCGMGTVTE
jgi:hypothetical protein